MGLSDSEKRFLDWLDENPLRISRIKKPKDGWTNKGVTASAELAVAEMLCFVRAKFMDIFDVAHTSFTLSDREFTEKCLQRLVAGRWDDNNMHGGVHGHHQVRK